MNAPKKGQGKQKTARQVALESLLRVEEGGYSNLVLDHALTRARLNALDGAFATQLFYGVLERQITLDEVLGRFSKTPVASLSPIARMSLRLGLYQIGYMDKVPSSAAVNESVNLVKGSKESRASGYVNGVLRAVLRCENPFALPLGLSQKEALSFALAAPLWLVEHLWECYGQETAEEMLSACFGRPPLQLRVNSLRITPEALLEQLLAQGIETSIQHDCPGALTVEKGMGSMEKSESYQKGLFHVQDLASQYCCMALDPKPGDRLLDCCAAPGGKSFTLAQRMEDQGELVAVDLYRHKVGLIEQGARRLGISCLRAVQGDAADEGLDLGDFDKILCDVPCSGLGIIRRKPEIRYKNPTILDNLTEMQYRILCRNARRLRPGGRLVYSTCTLNPNENEQVVARFLAEHSEFAPAEILPDLARRAGEEKHHITLFPQYHHTDGFFIAAIEKRVSI